MRHRGFIDRTSLLLGAPRTFDGAPWDVIGAPIHLFRATRIFMRRHCGLRDTECEVIEPPMTLIRRQYGFIRLQCDLIGRYSDRNCQHCHVMQRHCDFIGAQLDLIGT